MRPLQPVILSGGSGSRLWPLSREAYPKQFLRLASEQTMLQDTIHRASGVDGLASLPPIIICNEDHRFLVAEQLLELGVSGSRIMLEPVGRNTAPALTLAAIEATRSGENPLLLVMPADHVIRNRAAFQQAVSAGATLAEQGLVVTFGITPDNPATGYGYIRAGSRLDAGRGEAYAIARFVEKPDLATASRYLEEGGYVWNSGIFLMTAEAWLKQIARYRPDILEICDAACAGALTDLDFIRIDKQVFGLCPSDSIDYAVMEHLTEQPNTTPEGAVIFLDAGWSDVGAWSTLWDVGDKDPDGNVMSGDTYLAHGSNNIISAQHRLVAGIGIHDLIIAETADAVMVAHKDHAQDVKLVVNWLNSQQRSESKLHREVARPWGSYEGVVSGERFQVKRIVVKPGAALSLQMHHHRAEHWIVVKGTARVTRGDEVLLVSENQSTYIPLGTLHRLENPGKLPLEMIEVQSGSYLGEDDIVRYDDCYGRHS